MVAPLRVIHAPVRAPIVSEPLHPHSETHHLLRLFPPAVHNYMDYTDDSCMNNFTPGQITRLRAQIAMYRGIP